MKVRAGLQGARAGHTLPMPECAQAGLWGSGKAPGAGAAGAGVGAGTRAGGSWSRDGVGRGGAGDECGGSESHVPPRPTCRLAPRGNPGAFSEPGSGQEGEPGCVSGLQPSLCRFLRLESVGVNIFPLEQLLTRLEPGAGECPGPWDTLHLSGRHAFPPPVLESLGSDRHTCVHGIPRPPGVRAAGLRRPAGIWKQLSSSPPRACRCHSPWSSLLGPLPH